MPRQAKPTNKIIKNNLLKMMDNNASNWDELLFDAIWTYRTSKRSSTRTMPYALVYGHDAVLPLEITIQSLRVKNQNQLSHIDYQDATIFEIDDLIERQLKALNSIISQKQKVTEVYNKKVKTKSFHERKLV